MFLKVVKYKGNEYLRIVESYREGGRVRHRTILNLGRLDQIRRKPELSTPRRKVHRIFEGFINEPEGRIRGRAFKLRMRGI